MAKAFQLSADRDLAVPVTLVEDVGQGVGVRLRNIRGEFPPNLRLGLPWLPNDQVPEADAILGGKPSAPRRARLRRELSAMVLSAPGVVRILDLRIDLVGRDLSIKCRALKSDGTVAEAEVSSV